jgi:protein TonB
MMNKLGPALIGAVIGMLLFWGMTKLVREPAPVGPELRPVSIELPALMPVDAPPPAPAVAPDKPEALARPEDGLQTAGIRGTDSSELTAGIRGVETEMVGTMVDRGGVPGDGPDKPQVGGCVDREVLPKVLVAPDYPLAARRDGVEGAVEVEFTIGADGRVSEAQVVSASPEQVFDRAALNAVQRWRFDARTVGCEPVAARVRQQLQFRLDADE